MGGVELGKSRFAFFVLWKICPQHRKICPPPPRKICPPAKKRCQSRVGTCRRKKSLRTKLPEGPRDWLGHRRVCFWYGEDDGKGFKAWNTWKLWVFKTCDFFLDFFGGPKSLNWWSYRLTRALGGLFGAWGIQWEGFPSLKQVKIMSFKKVWFFFGLFWRPKIA